MPFPRSAPAILLFPLFTALPASGGLLASAAAAATPPTTSPASSQQADDKTPPDKPADSTAKPDASKTDQKKPDEKKPQKGPKPYKDVITADAKSQPGLFKVHQIDDKVYFEIPADMLDRDMLWQTELEQLPAGYGYGGTSAGTAVVRWTRRENKVYLRAVNYDLRADDKGAIQLALQDASLPPILMAFDVEAEGDNKSAVIDVTHLLNSDFPQASPARALGAGGVDPARSYLDKIKAFPTNIETKVMMTFGGGGAANPFMQPRPGGGSGVTALVHYSLDLLPEKPMQGRLLDSRVGYFSEGFEDYGRPEHRVVERAYIARYRLEKKDPTAKVSEPVKPIVYYISREVPEKWRPYMKKAVEAWNEAFEQAGFKNAIIAKDAPTVEEDPDWDPEDARYSVIRWAPTETENAMGPHVHDPRSGEIISAHIIVWHNVLKLAEDWYFTQVSPDDPRAQKLPLPDDLMGQILEYVVCHEVGHTLGLQHNFKASSTYTIAQLRNRDFTAKNGDEASIMDYGRFNYVSQPEDHAVLIPRIGPYDRFAIEWGYTPFPGKTTPDDEKVDLDLIAARQVKDPTLRWGAYTHPEDPTQETEDLGDDPVEATRLGLKNIDRVAKYLVPATTKFGEEYDLLDEEYNTLLDQRMMELMHVARLVGGVVQTDYHVGRGGAVFAPEPPEKQAQAVQFLLGTAFTTPKELLSPDILYRIQSYGAVDRVASTQRTLLSGLLGDARLGRMLDAQALNPNKAYTVERLVTDLQNGIWSDLAAPHPSIDLYRRNLQRTYLGVFREKLAPDAPNTDFRPIAVDALKQLAHRIDLAIPRAMDSLTAAHLQESRKEIERILDPKFQVANSAPRFFFGLDGINRTMQGPSAPANPYQCDFADGTDFWAHLTPAQPLRPQQPSQPAGPTN